ncbi:AraC family transcriptional regulator N-terminal domain-containing protein [Kribbella qitaiheensis]|uniref:AraC family transcriptional regulator n=1 Tax=Kribbella qitaiheensis TaxID=1544730 RepID=UPI00361A5013
MALGELRKLLERHARADLTTSIEGVRVCRFEPGVTPASSMSGTSLALIAQGSKRLVLGSQVYDYGPGQYLVTSVDLPVTGQAVGTGTTLGFGMTLDGGEIADLVANAEPGELPQASGSGEMISVSDAPDELLDAVVRLLRLLDRPTDRRILAPMIKREIVWRLLTGHNGDAIRQIGLADSGHIRRAIRWIRENYTKPFKVEEVAQVAGLSVSAFYRNFHEATSMSPIQFQKQIRLQEARLLLASRPNDVSTVGHRVGYGSVSQFSREYRRQFGTSPSLDTVRTGNPEPAGAAALP